MYKVNCVDCDRCYIGQTRRHLGTRLKEHRQQGGSAVHEHMTAMGHEVDFADAHVLTREHHLFRREVKEAIYIATHRCFNGCVGNIYLSPVWRVVCSSNVVRIVPM